MPRVGTNPLKYQNAPAHFPNVLLTVITHLPHNVGYHTGRMKVVQRCLESMDEGDAKVLVWDNGSTPELRNWLQQVYRPDFLILSPNIGKAAARQAILNMVPPETIVALSDDDMEFSSGWLDAHLQLLKGFPNVGAVSGFPVRYSFGWGNVSTLAWAQENATLEQGRFLPETWEADYALSIGSTPERIANITANQQDYRVTYEGMTAYAQAQHCQMVCYAGRIAPFCVADGSAVGDERPFDLAIDAAGLLRLTTTKKYVRHLGNRL